MDTITLGRTNLQVSVMGMGGGGPSRLGSRDNRISEAESIAIVQQALDAGVNFIDTAEAYGTEEIVGKAIKDRLRESVVISSKKTTWDTDMSREAVISSLENSLRRLDTDYIDIYHLHGVEPDKYEPYLQDVVPVLQAMQQQGKIRFIGVTEAWNSDKEHIMLQRALQDDIWDVFMVGYNLLNQTARKTVLQPCIEQNIGTLIMFAVRRALSLPDHLKDTLQKLIDSGELDAVEIDMNDPLGFLTADGIAESIPDAAYRFSRYTPGVHVTLSGTGNPAHLQQNIASLQRPPLPSETVERLNHIFRKVRSVTGQ
ncbi:MAG: aldo/keto reductase [Anaerolineaceae bacterium]|nr:aldo/keto reductase [Anaerolineaceae bacterium]